MNVKNTGGTTPQLTVPEFQKHKIPLPNPQIYPTLQDDIVNECRVIDKEVEKQENKSVKQKNI